MHRAHAGIATPRAEWLALHREDIIDPELPIVDAHHHLWVLPTSTYLHAELTQDLRSGHNIRSTVFVDCHSHYRTDGLDALRPVGETAFAAAQADASAKIDGNTRCCAAIVGWVDLSLGDLLSSVLQAHVEAGKGRFRGVRARPTWHADPAVHPAGAGREGVLRDALVQQGVRRLGAMGLSLDLWVYHTQLGDVVSLAANCPDTLMVLNHCGGPLGIGPLANQGAEVFDDWLVQLRALARLPNVRIKLGGLAMPRMGFGLDRLARPADSATLASLWRPCFEACIEAFGADRCMFESNFPVDKTGCSYAVLWNAFKRATVTCNASERSRLFSGTAALTYSIDP
ncbi:MULTISPECIES: amidohydrolase family protein [unclassified Variovorax]|uniref:amidohydrolase family protein n=1 Tax=unclassified Variovorax TaxID=663243 RepID=UPI003F48DA84